MNDLIETFAAARFGKQAFLKSIFGKPLDPKKRAIRDRIEDMIRAEQRKRKLAREAVAYGKHRLEEAPKSGLGGWAMDVSRSLIPGLSISASHALDGLVKHAVEKPPEKRWRGLGSGRLFDLAHVGAAGAGAGIGYIGQKGRLGDVGSAARVAKGLGSGEIAKELSSAVGRGDEMGAIKRLLGTDPTTAVLAGQKRLPVLTRVVEKLSPTYWARRVGGKAVTPAQARAVLSRELAAKGVAVPAARKLLKDLPGLMGTARSNILARLATDVSKRVPLRGKAGAILGALGATLPFVLARLWKTRRLRASGGTAGQAAVQKAEELLGGAEKLRQEREGLMKQLG